MNYALLEPSLLSISEEDWYCECSRDEYLEHFNSIMNCINDSSNIKLAWNDLYDDLFWTSPQKRPWKMDRYWSNTIIPIIYEKLQKNAIHQDLGEELCEVEPKINCEREDLYSIFCKLIPQLNSEGKDSLICFGSKNIPIKPHEFFVSGEKIEPTPRMFYSENCFLSLIDIESELWPTGNDDNESFKKAINIKIARDLCNQKILYDFCFSQKFLKKISKVNIDRDKIITAIARRLIMNTSDAGRDGCLQDENIEGQESIRRLRVTPRPSSKRIHYKNSPNKIEFLMFYDVGEHDDGL
ncbi:hypothetical protein [Photobacterium leiognathi]|uniref:hypothetical protein n=1 Tax=Photobacterium leiognathi TaxID=553611 RepID=UPI00298168A5|nr:hypothetical protein [Photobacterium leiognathi]